ncbi:peptidylprolyl isomerase [Knoellia remsis]|uniref:Peptidyl-prolyl cis-trans isomerase n=1 Tax=Knoellia remsis TaxID=407159 RepID=A0A2T0UAE0_9MICO|nr:FKBP-type peptidyl-prolyl cis-trans isomerase [Knoellia remsis]PRY54852.1 peptidylprolyl isomerase [Knoellia remsis]
MSRPRFTTLSAALVAGAVALAGCGSSSDGAGEKKDSGPLAQVKVEGAAGAEPKVTIAPLPLKVTSETKRVITEGKGEPLTKDSLASVNVQLINGVDGKVASSTWTDKQPFGLDLTNQQMLPIFANQLPGTKPGGRVLLAAPVKDVYGPQGNQQLGLKPEDPLVFLIDVVSASPSLKEATGTAVPPKAGLPTVKMNPGKPATITMPKTKAPTKLVAQPLITGKGPKVEKGQTIRIAYTGALWANGKVFDSNPAWSTPIGVGQVVPGWDKSLVGQTVGSRMLLVVPPADGYGPQGQGEIKGTDTMVFVVDILGAV